MATERSRQLVLGGLVVALIAILVKVWPGTSGAPPVASNRTANTSAPRQQAGATEPGTPVVHLHTLNDDRPGRPADKSVSLQDQGPAPSLRRWSPVGAAILPAPVRRRRRRWRHHAQVHQADRADNAKIAILSDGQNPPFLGKEGAIIEGRYRILKIGVESVELAYADGRGRQTIRLTGS
jgi:hypothetical protein